MSTTANYPELLSELAANIGDKLIRKGIQPEVAAEIGLECAEDVRKNWGKQLLYIPCGDAYDQYNRDLDIYAKFNGRNHGELAKEYGVNIVRIYQIIKACRDRDIKSRQSEIFE